MSVLEEALEHLVTGIVDHKDEVTLLDVVTGELPAHVLGLADQPDAWRNR